MKVANLLFARPSAQTTAAVTLELLDQFYLRVLGFTYQVLGDAELAAQATEAVFLHGDLLPTEVGVWRTAMETVQTYLSRGFVVRPLAPQNQGWQAELLHGLAQLEPLERALLLLRYHEALEVETLAEVLKVSERDVRHRVAAARAQLLTYMDE